MDIRGKRLLLVGGAGLIGSHTADALLGEDVAEVRIYDNFSRGTLANLESARRDSRLRIFEGGGDILDRDALEAAMEGIDGVFHFAALWLLHCEDDPRSALDVNVGGTLNVAEACLRLGVPRLVFSSSASVYGEALAEPMMEDHPFNNDTVYGATKIADEQMLRALYRRRGAEKRAQYVALRYMNVYGPRQDYRGAYVAVFMKFLDRLGAGLPPVVYGDGSQAYDFIFVGDCARANVLAMKADTTDAVYNVATGVKTTVRELAETLLELTHSPLGIRYESGGQSFVTNRVGSPERAAREIGFRAGTPLREGLQRLIEWRRADQERSVGASRGPATSSGAVTPPRTIAIARPATGEEEWRALREPLLDGWVSQGPRVAAFESEFAKRHQVRFAVATTSCTTALHLILTALGIGQGDEVLVPAFTWVATANAVTYCGATPVFVDVDRDTFNMNPAFAARRRTPRTRAAIAVHLFGLCADMDALAEALPGVPLIEDAACAAGAAYRGRSAGSLGKAAAFSFHARKAITTGEGGMITTDDPALAEAVSLRRSHGAQLSAEQRHRGPQPYLLPEFDVVGFNYRMTDLQAALGSVQLSKLDRLVAERRRWAAYYGRELAGIEWLRAPAAPEGYEHSWQSYVLMLDESRSPRSRNEIMEALHARGIATRPGTHAVHRLGCYRGHLGGGPEDCPAASDCERFSIAIPLHNRMSADDYATVVDALRGLA